MSKKIILFLGCFVFLFSSRFAWASIVINEVQIGATATNDEFIELYNSGSDAVDLAGWSIKKKTSSGAEYSLVVSSRLEGKTIQSNSYFLLTNENGYVGSVTPDGTWASSNTLASNNTIILYNANQTQIDKVGWGDASDCGGACPPNPTDGQSLQKTSSGWILGANTPKTENKIVDNTGNTNTNENTNTNTNMNASTKNTEEESATATTSSSGGSSVSKITPKKVEIPTIKLKILTTPLAFVGQPILFGTSLLGYSDEKLVLGKLFWNFGDGSSYEQINNFEKFNHLYLYQGEYAVTLEYYKNSYDKEPEVVSKLNLKVVPLTVSISKTGDLRDFFVELSNNSNYDMDISGWVIRSDGKMFVLPRGSTILAKGKMILSGITTGFSFSNNPDLKLYSILGELVFDYNPSFDFAKNIVTPKERAVSVKQNIKSEYVEEEGTLNNNELAGSAILASGVAEKKANSSYVFFFGFVALLIISSIGIYYIRRNRNTKSEGDDFHIIDE